MPSLSRGGRSKQPRHVPLGSSEVLLRVSKAALDLGRMISRSFLNSSGNLSSPPHFLQSNDVSAPKRAGVT
ncbi:unnamed protein product [Boreogadus saida]